jgi:hypothetical protein
MQSNFDKLGNPWFPDSFNFPPGFNELHCSLSIGGIPLLILAKRETRCVGKNGGISPVKKNLVIIHTYHSRFIPGGVAEVSQIFLRDTHVLPKLVSYEENCRRGR